jgi:hypothetical protein
VAEIGDKTQVATVLLAAKYPSLVAVVLGTTLGMLLANVPGRADRKGGVREDTVQGVRITAALLFAALGVYALAAPARRATQRCRSHRSSERIASTIRFLQIDERDCRLPAAIGADDHRSGDARRSASARRARHALLPVGRCRLPNSYLYDKEIIPRVKTAILTDGRFAETSISVLGQRRWVILKGVRANEAQKKGARDARARHRRRRGRRRRARRAEALARLRGGPSRRPPPV